MKTPIEEIATPGGESALAAAQDDSAPVLSAGIRLALRDTRIAPDGRTAWVRADEVTADSASMLRIRLAYTLYEVLHTGRGVDEHRPHAALRAPDFETRLVKATPHPETVVAATLTGQRSATGRRVVELDGLRIGVPDSVTLRETARPGDAAGHRPVLMRIASARPLLSAGFFLVDSGTGRIGGRDLLRLYLRVADADAAPELWHAVLSALERRAVTYRAKIISNPANLPRNDGMVVYLGSSSRDAADAVIESAVATGLPAGPPPVFAHVITPGISAAWEPSDSRAGMRGLSFGEHRAHVIAQAFVEAAARNSERPTIAELAAAYTAANVDPGDPARNLDSAGWPWSENPGPGTELPDSAAVRTSAAGDIPVPGATATR